MRSDKQAATKLRQQGKSYNRISRELGVPKSTLSYWFRGLELSPRAQATLYSQGQKKSVLSLIRRNKDQTRLAEQRAEQIKAEAKTEARNLLDDKLFLLGVALYWAEGYKRGATGSRWKCVDFTNADPKMILVMMRFFRELCKVPEKSFRAQLITHQNVRMTAAVEYWSVLTKIPATQFIQTSVSKKKSVRNVNIKKTNVLPMGTLHVRVYDVQLFFRIIGWIEVVQVCFTKPKGL